VGLNIEKVTMGAGWFDFSRKDNYGSRFSDQRTAAHHDILTDGFIVAFGILFISSCIPLLSHQGIYK